MARTRSAKRGGGQATVAGAAKATKRRLGVRTHGGDGALHVPMPAMRGARAKAAAGTKHPGVQEAMESLPTSAEHVRPAAPIRALLSDARDVLAIARRSGTKLIRAGLDRRFLEELPHRIELLDRAQKAWERQRSRTEPASMQRAREDAAQLKTDMLAAGRFLLRNDDKAQRQLDQIAAGEGLEDLIEDLRALAVFWRNHEDALEKSDLGDDVMDRAHAMATRLTIMNRCAKDREHETAHAHRNRALALLDEAVHEVRAAGRYVFRDAPERLALFRYEFRHVAK
jgi:hypothetical protein